MSAIAPSAAPPLAQARPIGRAAFWLACLGPFFYVTYGTANWLASLRAHVPTVVFDWERQVPFLDWTILPYWSTNAFYAASFFVCTSRKELDAHGRRLLTAQIVAVICFIAFPLRFSWPKPETSGLFGFMFEALGAFDKPFNQAPSLHVALTVILWNLYSRHLRRVALPLFHAWSMLVVVSVMTTFQHHFFDIPTGALLGFACVWAWPEEGASPFAQAALTRDPDRLKLAMGYGAGAAVLATLAIGGRALGANPGWLWMLWPAVSLAMLALAYLAIGPALSQKRKDGTMGLSARILTAPYRLGAFVNSRMWTHRDPAPVEIADGVWLGRFPTRADLHGSSFGGGNFGGSSFRSVVDVTAEFAAPSFAGSWHSFPMLDLVAPAPDTLVAAAAAIEAARRSGPVLVCCALGYGRSVAAIATWLVRSGRAQDAAHAVATLRRSRPRLALSAAQLVAIEEAAHGS